MSLVVSTICLLSLRDIKVASEDNVILCKTAEYIMYYTYDVVVVVVVDSVQSVMCVLRRMEVATMW